MAAKQICFAGFVPCRNEKCRETEIHPEHPHGAVKKTHIAACPKCSGAIVSMPRQRARCLECTWRGSRLVQHPTPTKKKKEAHSHA